MPTAEPIIEFQHVSKCFTLDTYRPRSIQETLVQAFQRSRAARAEELWALRDVSFQVARGETVGLIGANGSGKSTVLKLISQIIYPSSGVISVRGRVAALLELGAGFHPDLSGRENIYLNGSILGLNRRYIRRQLDEIVAFAELERFIDMPIRNYSSGMLMRLGFAVATAFQPDILLIDEVLAVGDQAFQDRCLRRIAEIQRRGATIILVSHDLGSVQRLCRRVVWLEEGCVRADGDTDEVIARYLQSLWTVEQEKRDAAITDEASEPPNADAEAAQDAGEAPVPEEAVSPAKRWGSGKATIEKAELLDERGVPATIFRSGRPFVVRMWYFAKEPVECPAFGVSIYDEQGNRINGPNTVWSGAPIPSIHGRGYVDYIVDELPLLPGRYDLTVAIYDRFILHPYDHWHRMTTFTVVRGDLEQQDGLVYIPCRWEQHALLEAHL
jgi:lipopolysaccharide transport system ATP-binding protein